MSQDSQKTNAEISHRLAKLLTSSGCRKADVIDACGIPARTVLDYFSGKAIPTPDDVDKLASFFGVPKDQIDPRLVRLPPNMFLHEQEVGRKIPLVKMIVGNTPVIQGCVEVIGCNAAAAFAVECTDDSMQPKILKGDKVVVEPGNDLKNVKVAVIQLVGQSKIFLRCVKQMDGNDWLVPANKYSSFSMLKADDESVRIIGKAVQLIRML